MPGIAKALPATPAWDAVMQTLQAHLRAHGQHAAQAVVLLPYHQLLPVARAAWSACADAGFMPRFETTQSWARQLGGFVPDADDLAFDAGRDLLRAQRIVHDAGLARRQPGLTSALAQRLLAAAQALAPLAAARPPTLRAAWAEQARAVWPLGDGALALEAALHQAAVAWAAASAYPTDRLFQQLDVSAPPLLAALPGLRPDPLTDALLRQQSAVGGAVLHLDGPAAAVSDAVRVHEAQDAEDEAERAAACVLRQLEAGHAPVALPALDRGLTRRIRALLAERGVRIADETGWKLSTTRAAARLLRLLEACAWNASTDAVLDAVKNLPACAPADVDRLEAELRAAGHADWARYTPRDAAARQVWQQVRGWRDALQEPRSHARWRTDLHATLHACGLWQACADDAAGAQMLDALHLHPDAAALLPDVTRRVQPSEFAAWVRQVLEAQNFMPSADADAQLVVLPLAQLHGRHFAALVMPGCDEVHLPASVPPPGLWSDAQRAALGLPTRDQQAASDHAAWLSALQAPVCDLLWRGSERGERCLASPWLRQLMLQRHAAGAALAAGTDPRLPRPIPPRPASMPRPAGAALLPARLSASGYQALRDCPYRYFALHLLGLRASDELDAEPEKRDFGIWLHAVLRLFHDAGGAPGDLALIDDCAARARIELGLDEAAFLPFAANWPALRDGYLHWLAQHLADGARYAHGEQARERAHPALPGLLLHGKIDRIDQAGPAPGVPLLIDYKTEAPDKTRRRIAAPLEDVQLAFYAALLGADDTRAAYLNLAEDGQITWHALADVADARDALLAGIASDWQRLRDGQALPALGDGPLCEHCDARGLCRKDDWSVRPAGAGR